MRHDIHDMGLDTKLNSPRFRQQRLRQPSAADLWRDPVT